MDSHGSVYSEQIFKDIDRVTLDLNRAYRDSVLVGEDKRLKSGLTAEERALCQEISQLATKIQSVKNDLRGMERKDLSAQKVRVLYLEKAALNIQLKLLAVKVHELPRTRELKLQKGQIERARKDVNHKLKESLMGSTHKELQRIQEMAKSEREFAEILDIHAWTFLEKNQPLMRSHDFLPKVRDFESQVQLIKAERRNLREELYQYVSMKNELEDNLRHETDKKNIKNLQRHLSAVKGEIRKIEEKRANLREKQLQMMLVQGLELVGEVEDKQPLFDRIDSLQKEFNELFEYTGASNKRVSLDPFSEIRILTPLELQFRKKCVESGYSTTHSDLLDNFLNVIQTGKKFPTETLVEDFMHWAHQFPDQAQFMVEGISLMVAAANDAELTQKFGDLMEFLAIEANKSFAPTVVTDESLYYLELSDLFRNIWHLSKKGDVNAKTFLDDQGLTFLNETIDLQRGSGLTTFEKSLADLRRRGAPLFNKQVRLGVESSKNYKKMAHKEFLSEAYEEALKSKRKGKKPKLKASIRFNWKEVKKWTKEVVTAKTTRKRVARAVALAASGAGAGVVLAAGYGITILTGGIGIVIGGFLIGASAGTFSFLYSSLNKFIDKIDTTPKIGEDEALKLILSTDYVIEMKERGVIPNYGKTPKLNRSQKKARSRLQKAIIEDLKIRDSDTPLEIIEKFTNYVNDCYPSKAVFRTQNDPAVSLAAVNYAIDRELRKKIAMSVERHSEDWKYPGKVEKTKDYKKRILKEIGLR